MTAISFTIPGSAVPYARTGGGASKPRFTPKRQRDAMAVVKLAAARAMEGRPLMEGAIWLTVEAHYQIPRSWSSKRRQREGVWKVSRPDLTNIVKLVEDACNKVVWVDDAQIAAMSLSKRYGDREELRIRVEVCGSQ